MQSSGVMLSDLSDRDLERRIATSLADRQMPGLRQLQVAVNNGTVTLRGRVRVFMKSSFAKTFATAWLVSCNLSTPSSWPNAQTGNVLVNRIGIDV